MDIATKVIGQNIRRLRKNLGLKQAELAEMLDVAVTTANRWETGHFSPDEAKQKKLAEIFKIDVIELLQVESKPASTPQAIIAIDPQLDSRLKSLEAKIDAQSTALPKDEEKLLTLFRQVNTSSQRAIMQFIEAQLAIQLDQKSALLKKRRA
jgi:transcriptional regulator with XRE-family HTH domain